ncbi:MAG: hypothetical protein GW893_04730 [Armatimonadetes bacterium]|nr:hypothetical protein [Armatimonadota bacterium]PIU64117.1 MAG: hypothetical protein COS85_13685 [Armatimonadetes bacterium CG07_land_8_20_14_0_80_59_28]PIX41422.1 MAG: hypothetical protein COZ56_12160 [Armatimonadetes bacterium CG_4_8_14_3_um_filter_58_9]PIY45657.1 MAG: hypothetical protein COZ05_06330 [Armatimonadetes bacterium CG_4_10_14_3_um_filter_59_10]PJB78682.1 MAG: hypothetical protein CO095_00260 [Armatimonadetes bacterium CG_4_9_14_3_um_filter_58_7]
MEFPTERMDITYSHGGNNSGLGWLVLNLSGLDMEGVNKLYVDIESLGALKDKQKSRESQADFVREFFAKKE